MFGKFFSSNFMHIIDLWSYLSLVYFIFEPSVTIVIIIQLITSRLNVMRICNFLFQIDSIYSQYFTNLTALICKPNTQITCFKIQKFLIFKKFNIVLLYLHATLVLTSVEYMRNIGLHVDLAIQTIVTDYMNIPKCIDYFNVLKRVLLIMKVLHHNADIEIRVRNRSFSILVKIFKCFVQWRLRIYEDYNEKPSHISCLSSNIVWVE